MPLPHIEALPPQSQLQPKRERERERETESEQNERERERAREREDKKRERERKEKRQEERERERDIYIIFISTNNNLRIHRSPIQSRPLSQKKSRISWDTEVAGASQSFYIYLGPKGLPTPPNENMISMTVI